MVNMNSVINGLIAVLIIYEILVNGYEALIPTATAITVVGINFAFVVILAVLIVVFKALQSVASTKGWK